MARRQITQSLVRSVVRWRPMCDRWRINRARPGEKYSARTSVVRRRTAGARSQRVGDGASIAYVGAKYFSPVHPWCGGVWRARDHNVRLMAHQSRTDGRKIFRPYIRGAPACGGCAIITCGRWRINCACTGEKYFAPTHAARCYIEYAPRVMVWRCLMVGRMDIVGARRGEKYFARTNAARC